ncbi:MAG: Crp/Fnr family transcriptional regulator [Deltaproteobacteria bacterium]|nr:Crp/Fnr family transcriptional regulator [Deltaproteobacteria bacterium]
MDQFQRFLFLRTMPGLAEVPPEISQVIAANTRERLFPKGEHLYRSGVPALEIQYVVSGECEIIRNGRAVRRLGPRSVVGGVSALAGEELGYDCIALEDMVTLAIAVEDSQEIFEDHFVLLKRVLRGTSREVLETRRKLGPGAGFGLVSEPFAFPERPFDLVERMAFLRKTFSFGDSEIDAIADLAREHVLPAPAPRHRGLPGHRSRSTLSVGPERLRRRHRRHGQRTPLVPSRSHRRPSRLPHRPGVPARGLGGPLHHGHVPPKKHSRRHPPPIRSGTLSTPLTPQNRSLSQ